MTLKALIWLEECQIVYWNLRFSRAPRLYGVCSSNPYSAELLLNPHHIDWGDWFPGDLQFSVQYAKARAAAAAAFLSFGNTGTAVHRRYTATLMIPQDHQRREPAISRTILHRGGTQTLTTLRHPDPMMVHRHKITQPSLQLLGSWKKLKVNKGSCAGPGRRMSFSTFIWEGSCAHILLLEYCISLTISITRPAVRRRRQEGLYGTFLQGHVLRQPA